MRPRSYIELAKAAVEAVAIVTPAIKQGTMYSYFLVPAQPSNVLQGRVVDNISGNYNYKLGIARVKKVGVSKYKDDPRFISFAPRNVVGPSPCEAQPRPIHGPAVFFVFLSGCERSADLLRSAQSATDASNRRRDGRRFPHNP